MTTAQDERLFHCNAVSPAGNSLANERLLRYTVRCHAELCRVIQRRSYKQTAQHIALTMYET